MLWTFQKEGRLSHLANCLVHQALIAKNRTSWHTKVQILIDPIIITVKKFLGLYIEGFQRRSPPSSLIGEVGEVVNFLTRCWISVMTFSRHSTKPTPTRKRCASKKRCEVFWPFILNSSSPLQRSTAFRDGLMTISRRQSW